MAKVLYIGDSSSSSTSGHRANALKRLKHDVDIQDPYQVFAGPLNSRLLSPIHYRTGYRLLQKPMVQWVKGLVGSSPKPDVIWVDSGELLGPECLKVLREFGCPIILYNVDDPTGKRDGRRFDMLVKAIQAYDCVVVVRRETEEECNKLGAKRVIRVLRSYDEEAHKPFAHVSDIPAKYISEVVFIGTWMRHERRDEFLLELLNQGVPISIWGGRWKKSPNWAALEKVYCGGALGGRDYVAAIQGSKLCLGLLSKGNRDLHTQRSLEVPFAGGLLCAERTSEHQEIYQEGKEAVFWSSAAECAEICKKLLADDTLREEIRLAGMAKVRSLKVGNEDICRRILDAVL
ncbi:glycosyltransferase [Hymenobacter nivis]|uniref:Glycosyltransferase family 1 protein n=1 Tax=Hymenobacter nivis TaxID=1850093 RepID=A0A502GTJ0_9BACT|nr:glycosyltransferase [Hymenobacter nivis]TPG65539.1 glycosyltransferase family 1 protein [Hymenobacter nivis]